METEDQLFNKYRQHLHHKYQDCASRSYIFQQRAARFKSRLRLLNLFGVLTPALVGIIVTTYNLNSTISSVAVVIAAPITIIQFSISLWSFFYRWDDELSYAYEAMQSYKNVEAKYYKMANFPSNNILNKLKKEAEPIDAEYQTREQLDVSHDVRPWEDRMGMRYSLYQYQCKCTGCQIIPISLENTNCTVCGNFSIKNRYKLLNFI